jgi:uncharacterized protein YfaS (alpha-2-macroglobulin family)
MLLATSSCGDGVKLPPVKGPPLSVPSSEGRKSATNEPLKVVFKSPKGKTRSPHLQITVTFNKPMVSLSMVEKRAEKAPLTIEPAVEGKQRWLSTRTIAFITKRPLSGSTKYQVSIAAGLSAVDGSKLAEAQSWTFETPRIRVLANYMSWRTRRYSSPNVAIKLRLNQPTDPRRAAKHLSFMATTKNNETVTIAASAQRGRRHRRGPLDPKFIIVKPVSPLPLDSHISLRMAPGMVGLEGPLPMEKSYAASFRTYGPFRVTGLSCKDGCDPNSAPSVKFSTPVRPDWAHEAIRVNGRKLRKTTSKWTRTYISLSSVPRDARKTYRVTIAGGLKDTFGQTLQPSKPLVFKTGDYDPYLHVPVGSGVVEATGPSKLPVAFLNIKSAKLRSKRMSAAELSKALANGKLHDRDKPLLTNFGAKEKTIALAKRPNKRQLKRFALTKLLGAKKRGVLGLELESVYRADGKDRTIYRRAFLRVSDLGITAKYGPHQSLVWVTRLSSGKPVKDASVSIYPTGDEKPAWQGRTDAHGMALAPGALKLHSEKRDYIYFVEFKNDANYTRSTTQSGLRPWDYNLTETWEDGKTDLLGMVFTDRGIYRPGDTVQLKGILRKPAPKGLTIPSGSVLVKINDARGEPLLKKELSLSELGSFHMPIQVPAVASLGRYSVQVEHGSSKLHSSFRVEEYRVAEFAVTVSPKKRHLVRGETLEFTSSGRYMFGAPMRRAKQYTYINWSRTYFSPPGHEGFTFHNEINWWGNYVSSSGSLGSIRGKLDEKGITEQKRKLAPSKMDAPRRYTVETTVTDLSRQSISNRSSVLLHPGTFYIGAKAKETFLTAGKTLRTSVIAATRDGKLKAGQAIVGTLYERTWHQIRKKGYGGRHYFVTRPRETKVSQCKVTSATKPVACDLKLPKAGYYVLRLTSKDERQNPLQTSFSAYASGPGYVPWRRDNAHRIQIVTDRKRYKVGQTARLLIKSPFANAHGLLTVERNGIYVRRPITIKKTASWVNIPITPELLPNAFVSLVLVRGRIKTTSKPKANEEDPGRPIVKMGYATLKIDQVARRLKVDVKPLKKTYRPGQEVVVDLQTRDANGKAIKSELTVFAADEGVLSLVGYKTPNPMSVFYAERGLSIRTSDNRVVLLSRRIFGQKGRNPGGGGGGRGESDAAGGVRKNFVTTPYFNPTVYTDANGKARIKFKLPDNLTTYRVMAVAVGGAEFFGSGDNKVVVNKPLLMLPTLPRYVRVGDSIEAGVVLHNHSGKNSNISVKVNAKGVTLDGPASQSLSVISGRAAEARFRFKATAPGKARFVFRAQLGDFRDGLQLDRQVKLPLVKEVVATHGATDKLAAEGILPQGDLRSDVGGLEVSMSSSALVGLKASFEYLMNYPYECTEQSVSRLIPLAILKELTAAYGLKRPAALSALVGKLVARIQQNQRWSGGFSYWSSSSYVSSWLSAYATWGLAMAKKQGAPVSDKVLAKAKRYLKQRLGRKLGKYDDVGLTLATRAFVVHVLAELGDKPSAAINRLYEQRDKLPVFARALLLSAMSQTGGDKQAMQTLLDDVLNQVHQTGKVAKIEEDLGYAFATIFHSSNRSTAMVLDALLRIKPDHPLVDKLVAYLVGQRKNGRWRNTQETAYALLGMQRYYRAREAEEPNFTARVLLGSQELIKKRFEGRSLKVYSRRMAMSQLIGKKGVLGFVLDGKGRLHYTARLTYARAKLPQTPWDEGFFVTRSYEPIRSSASSFAALRGAQPAFKRADTKAGKIKLVAGDMVRVKLRIVVPQQMHYVVVDDPLPAGLEAVNFNLMTAARHRRSYTSSSYGSRHGSGRWWYSPFYHRETRDDRVQLFADRLMPGVYTYVYLARATTIGRFVAPPTKVEQMYEPEVFGRTATNYVDVASK